MMISRRKKRRGQNRERRELGGGERRGPREGSHREVGSWREKMGNRREVWGIHEQIKIYLALHPMKGWRWRFFCSEYLLVWSWGTDGSVRNSAEGVLCGILGGSVG